MVRGSAGGRLNSSILDSLKRQRLHVIDPILDLTDPEWPELPRYQVNYSFHSRVEIGPNSALGSSFEMVFITDDGSLKPMDQLIQDVVGNFDWLQHAVPEDLP